MQRQTSIYLFVCKFLILLICIVYPVASGWASDPSPKELEGLQLWLAADVGVVTEDNSSQGGSARDVTSWADQSGHSRHVRNSDENRATRPELTPKVAAFGEKPVIEFKGKGGSNFEVTDWLLGVGTPFDLNRATVFMVGKMDYCSTISAFTLGPNADSKIGRGGVGFRRGGQSKSWFCVHNGGPGNGKKVQSTESPLDDKPHVLTGFFNKPETSMRTYIDGKKTPATERDAEDISMDPVGYVQVGGHGILDPPGDPGAEWFFSGQIAEIVVFNRLLKSDEFNAVGWYLQKKYQLGGAFVEPESSKKNNAQSEAKPPYETRISQEHYGTAAGFLMLSAERKPTILAV